MTGPRASPLSLDVGKMLEEAAREVGFTLIEAVRVGAFDGVGEPVKVSLAGLSDVETSIDLARDDVAGVLVADLRIRGLS